MVSVNQASLIQQLRDRHLIPQAKTTLIAHPPAPTELPGLQLLHDGFYKILSVRSRASWFIANHRAAQRQQLNRDLIYV